MSSNPFEQTRIQQLTSTYSPYDPPKLMLEFGDYLSLLWRMDQCVNQPSRARYYRRCVQALGNGLGFRRRSLFRLVERLEPGEVYKQLPNAPYRGTTKLAVDAMDRRAAIAQLAELRDVILRIGTMQEKWNRSWPGAGILDETLRERVHAVLFTALQGQFSSFGRLLLVVDIVLGNLLLGFDDLGEVGLDVLIKEHGYPHPEDEQSRREYDDVG